MKRKNQSKQIYFCFQRWANKPYSVFNSLHKLIKIGVVCVTYTLVSQAGQVVSAQVNQHEQKAELLDAASVQAQHRQTLSEVGRIVSVITKDDIANSPASSITDLLASIAGVDIRNRGASGMQADISIRGGNFDQVLILLNGINITDPQTGHYNADLPLNLADVDRIEILQGAGARTHGPGAFSGAINIITGTKTTQQIKVALQAGQHGYLVQEGTINWHTPFVGSSKVTNYLSASHTQSDGYRPASDFNCNNFFLHSKFSGPSLGTIDLQAAYQNKAFGANTFYSPKFANQFDHTRTFFGSINWSKTINKIEFNASAYWRKHFDRFELIRDSAYGCNFHRTDVPGLQIKAAYYSPISKTTIGAGLRYEDIISNNIGTDLESPIDVHYANDIHPKPQYTKGSRRTHLFYYFDQSFYFNRWAFSAGLQGLHLNDYGNKINGGVDLSYQFSSQWKWVLSGNSATRLPTFTELFYKSPDHQGASNLQPETALSFETAIQYRTPKHSGLLSLYHRRGTNILDWIREDVNDKWESTNITKINTWGLETTWTYLPSAVWIKKLQVSVAKQIQDKSKSANFSKYTLDYLQTKCVLTTEHQIVNKLTANCRVKLHERKGSYLDTTQEENQYPVLFLADIRLAYKQSLCTVWVSFDNLFNTQYMDIANVPQAGLWVKTGIVCSF